MTAENKVILVTGASQGIGRGVAEAMLADGHRVVLAARRLEPLEAIAGAYPNRALPVSVDVGDPAAVDALYKKIAAEYGRLDALFNNAGAFMASTPIGDVDWDDWRRVLGVNLDGAFLMARGAFRLMRDQQPQGGRIINNGSISAHAPRVNSVAYTTSKHAITGLTKSITLDGRAHDIACSQIDIGNAETPMTEPMKAGIPQPDGSVMREPVMDVRHVADAVRYIVNLPLDANVQFMTVMATKMPYLGRG
ncbi:oxidoreductase, short chain dehydrogenase/reductase [Spiribacter salinus M19-40]|uniref:Oxidoreductase, short chain dehydrogenase/reductase n=1 Tax=Spiribacter salinus M19-40 TaxID=1260251 RepID=R4V2E1_9GAMM|nr:SDR family oxidoreductase [Spiribacter salinus]AGM40204.1 oxidoreductase, short chain dehydrogenase/reductase [Spiribacter salinus M19-40]MBY5268565.1 3-oxoacyl-ACP reductase [Spiribacter salinus]